MDGKGASKGAKAERAEQQAVDKRTTAEAVTSLGERLRGDADRLDALAKGGRRSA